MATSYRAIYASLLPKLKSYEIPIGSVEALEDELQPYLVPAIVKFHNCKVNLFDRDDESATFNVDLNDKEIDILGNYLLLEYIDSNYIRTSTNLNINLFSGSFNANNPSSKLGKLLELHDTFYQENETLLSRYCWDDYKPERQPLGYGYKKKN